MFLHVLKYFISPRYPFLLLAAFFPITSLAHQFDRIMIESNGFDASEGIGFGDLDGDGDLDAWVANDGSDRVWLNDGAGVFASSGQDLTSLGITYDVALGDIDGDGDIDSITSSSREVSIWFNDGTGVFTRSEQSIGLSSYFISLSDLNGNGALDAMVADRQGETNRVLLNDGSGRYTDSGQQMVSYSAQDIVLEDLDSDGDVDAWIAMNATSYADELDQVWLNDGSGVFTDTGQRFGFASTLCVSLGDLDNDGDLDAFLGKSQRASEVWLNDGQGNFTDSGNVLLGKKYFPWRDEGYGVSYVVLGDFDHDTDLDAFIVFGEQMGNAHTLIYFNEGNLEFSSIPIQTEDWFYQESMKGGAMGDVDGDGDLDILMPSDTHENILFRQNTAPGVTGEPSVNAFLNESYNSKFTFIDPDGDELVFSNVIVPSWLSFDETTWELSGTPDQLGVFTVSVGFTDGEHPQQRSLSITVSERVVSSSAGGGGGGTLYLLLMIMLFGGLCRYMKTINIELL